MKISLTFLGGVQTVTGSKFLIEVGTRKVLVDCGLFQGLKELRLRNWAPFPIDPKTIDAVVVTHAHLDHIGYLPLLVRDGFRGVIYSTIPTRSLSEIILLDAGHIQEEDAIQARDGGYSRHQDPKPLFTVDDARAAMAFFKTVELEKWQSLGDGLRFRFFSSGHILGSAFIEIDVSGTRFVFSGDLGRCKPLLLPPPTAIEGADFLILESTYGDRRHPKESVLRTFARVINETIAEGGDVLIPSFAVGRSQDILHLLAQLRRQKQLPKVPIIFDSPMGIQATRVFCSFSDWHRLNSREVQELCDIATMIPDAKVSASVAHNRKQKIVIAGSGMLTGGRVLNYLERVLPNPKSTIVLVGFQAAGTRGRLLRDGAAEIKVHGGYISVKAKIVELSGLSAHADQTETLEWLRQFKKPPSLTFLVYGEPQAGDALRVKIEDRLNWICSTPSPFEKVEIE